MPACPGAAALAAGAHLRWRRAPAQPAVHCVLLADAGIAFGIRDDDPFLLGGRSRGAVGVDSTKKVQRFCMRERFFDVQEVVQHLVEYDRVDLRR